MFEVTVGGKKYYIEKSHRKNKKYDVYNKEGHDLYITSFGDKRYQQYFDKLGLYSDLNHNDEKRRYDYLKRSKGIGNYNNPNSANFWSRNILW